MFTTGYQGQVSAVMILFEMIGVKKSATGVVTAKCEQRSVIFFLHLKGKDPVIIHHELKDVYGKKALSYVAVWKWTELLKNGCTDPS